MSTFQRCEKEVQDLANAIMCEYPDHKPLLDARVKIDLVFAYASADSRGIATGDALTHHGCKALGITRKVSIKERAMGRGDAEIALDGDWWGSATEAERKALLDHELHHIKVQTLLSGAAKLDDIGRPKIELRPHDYEFGWFTLIANRHGIASQERKQARVMMDDAGQYYWPILAGGQL